MKKHLLLFASFCAFFSFNLSAQEFVFKTAVGGNPTTANTNTSLGTQNGITVDVNVGAIPTADGVYAHFTLNSTTRFIKFTGTSDIKKISIQYRGTGAANAAGLRVKYFDNSTDLTAKGTASDDLSFSGGETYASPGKLAEFTVPAGVRYIEVTYNTANTSRIYYLAAGFSAYTLPPTYMALPLDFLSFTAKPDAFGKSVNLAWQTANEVNTDNFEIERRTDLTQFSSIGTVKSKNIAGTHSYTFVDQNPAQGTAYYRIKQIDFVSKFTYSDIKDVNVKPALALKLYPNPASAQLNVDHGYVEKGGSLKVSGLDGKNYLQQTINAGASSTPVNISALPPGTYLLIYQAADQKLTQKFIKN